MNSKIGVLTPAFRERRFIRANIMQFQGLGLRHLVVCSNTPWHGYEERDDTYNISLKAGANAVLQNFSSDAQQRNYGLRWLKAQGCEWALVVDADEFWTYKNLNKLISSLDDGYDVITAPDMSVYWKEADYLILPDPQPDNPIVAIKTDKEFSWSRLSDEQNRGITDAHFHHLSYVRSNYEMKIKMDSSEHSHELVPDWYNEVWMKWEPGNTNLHPVVPAQFSRTTYRPIPYEIGKLFD